jgi:hypothetical protein
LWISISSTAACITTQEMPLAPNAVRLDAQASGLLFTGKVASTTMPRAAELSLQKGFTHFRLEQAAMVQGYSSASVSGRRGYLTTSGLATPIYTPTASVAVTVLMLKADDPRATDALEGPQVRLGAKQ